LCYEEVLGPLIVLCKENLENKIKFIIGLLKKSKNQIYFKQNFISLFSSILRLGLDSKSQKVIESKIIAEAIFQETLHFLDYNSMNTNQLFESLYKWLTKHDTDELQEMQSSNSQSENSNDSKNQISFSTQDDTKFYKNQVDIIKSMINKFISTKKYFQFNLIETEEVIKILKKFSLLGQINKFQFISSINEIFKQIELKGITKLTESQKNDRISILLELLDFNSKPYDSIDLRHILSSICLLASSNLEDLNNILTHSFENQEEISLNDLRLFLHSVFSFLIKAWECKPYKNLYLAKQLSEILSSEILSFNTESTRTSLKMKQIVDYCYYLCSI
jgi:hypothetical protein